MFMRSGAILTTATAAEYGFRFIRNIILTRMLLPQDFGLMGAVMASISALEAFAEVGFRQSVIQSRSGAEPAYLNAVWFLSASRGLGLFAIAFLAAPWIAAYFRHVEATALFRTGFLVILINGLISPRMHLLEKNLKFGTWAMVMQTAGLIGSLSAIILGWLTRSVWALITACVLEAVIRVTLSYFACPFRPALVFQSKSTKEILHFAQGMFGLPLLMMIFVQADVFFLGRMTTMDLVGAYVLAKGLSEIPAFFTSKVINPVFLPSLSAVKDDPAKLAAGLCTATEITSLFALPLLTWMVLCAKGILELAYGAKYVAAAPAFAALSVYTFTLSCASLMMILYMALGLPGVHRTASLIRTAFMLVIIYPLIRMLGLTGAAVSVLLAGILLLGLQIYFVRGLIPIRTAQYFATWLEGLRLSLFFVALPWLVLQWIPNAGNVHTLIALGLCVVLSWCWVLRELRQRHGIRIWPLSQFGASG